MLISSNFRQPWVHTNEWWIVSEMKFRKCLRRCDLHWTGSLNLSDVTVPYEGDHSGTQNLYTADTQMCYCSSGESDGGSGTASPWGSPEREPGLHARVPEARSVWHRAWQCREHSVILGFPCWTCRLCQRVTGTPQACSQCSGQCY